MYNPPHPGTILREDVLPALGLQVEDAAKELGGTSLRLCEFVNGSSSVSPDLAYRLGKWLSTPTASMWLDMQTEYDRWQQALKS